ncbi:sigma-70 family RNA polymerase sigma factor [Thauera linaloolentis]|uniref:ECF subfamily RNA polymerase sigma factor n=1 Tax=Thauera linaloolentis (strain DSM 12138 / JCM 21573 / CCUG 41526 / CIP 105981 / IAM 15112 / NBRC 102519 / 47Lol) TaxID=1123367 RepID=N6YP69_THAL4|nr:sigma-70 family RNA polymerase sigma factor [Thauera linaloolentis]ENO83963.1 ECF subfamily RNA polymerase sigma factor [Thauera linaloolentis 47Lol = DSM 12138]MCM8567545.1 sigma-70 family RNA polymerase sigma factor [Thauera linaloolentis]
MSAARNIAQLYVEHHHWLHAWLRRKLGCTHQAADLTHDTFVSLLGKPCQPDEPRAYLLTIARRLVFETWRRRDLERAWLAELAAMSEAVAPSEEERAIMLETLLAIDALLDGLSAKARQAFLMSQLDGLTYAEIAAELGVSVSRVRQYMTQALTRCYAAV